MVRPTAGKHLRRAGWEVVFGPLKPRTQNTPEQIWSGKLTHRRLKNWICTRYGKFRW
jgi:hypothetical protein